MPESREQMELFDGGEPPRPRSGQAYEAPPSPAIPSREERLMLADALAKKIARRVGFPVRLAVTDNRSSMLTFRREGHVIALRIHHMFLAAPDEVVEALADYTSRKRSAASKVIDSFIDQQGARIRRLRRAGEKLSAVGKWLNLQELFDEVNRTHFDNRIEARIGWGRTPKGRRRKSIRLGVYEHRSREIRIHASLDAPDVPRYFVEFIVFHEMLHQLFPDEHHPKAFRERERTFPKYAQALAWEEQHLKRLLRR